MPDRHKSRPKAVRMPDGLEAWFQKYAAEHDQSVNAAIVEALEEFRDRNDPPSPFDTRMRATNERMLTAVSRAVDLDAGVSAILGPPRSGPDD